MLFLFQRSPILFFLFPNPFIFTRHPTLLLVPSEPLSELVDECIGWTFFHAQ